MTDMKTTYVLLMALVVGAPATSEADANKACRAVCGRITSCKLLSSSACMKLCLNDSKADDPSTYAQAKWSCSRLANLLAPSKWVCTAEGTSAYGHDMDGTLPDEWGTNDILMMGTGSTRAAASVQATNACNDMMTVSLNTEQSMRDDLDWGAAIKTRCHITQCIGPASVR